MAATQESTKTEAGVATTSAILKALITGLTNDPVIADATGRSAPPRDEFTNSFVTTVQDLFDYTTKAITLESIRGRTTESPTTVAPFVTSQESSDVMSGLDDMYTVVTTTEAPWFVLTPMLKWFIATGTIIVLVIILIIINCCLTYNEQVRQALKDVKHYAAEEKRVRREQNKIDMEEDRHNTRQTHVFWTLLAKGKRSPKAAQKHYSRC